MNREFKRDLNNNYMILSDNSFKTMDDFRIRMLISNQIPFILKCNVRKFDGIAKYYYEITSKHPMNRIYDKKQIARKELNNIVTSFLKVLDSSMEYLLNPNDFILEPEYIYMNIETNQVYFCYMPGYNVDISRSFNQLTSYLLEKIDHNDKHAVATAYELYRQTLNDNYSLRDILNSIKEDTVMEEYKKTEERKQEDTIKSEFVIMKEQDKDELKVEKKNQKIKPVYLFGVIVIISGLAFLFYYISINWYLIMSIHIDSDLLLQLGGVALIVSSLSVYIVYRKYQLRQEGEKEDDNLIVVSEPIENVIFQNEKKSDTFSKDDTLDMNHNKKLFKEERIYMSEPVNREEGISKSVYSKTFHSDDKCEIEGNILNSNLQCSQTEAYGNTMLLAYRAANSRLVSLKDKHCSFELTDKSFLIGKMQEYVDGVIQDELISRIHAEIRKNNGKYYLTDLNSTNGTYHNDRRIEANETVEIKPEDMIRFATAEYVFR